MKRVRKWSDKKFSYFHCGEYGETTRRPHYHALLFGLRFLDQVPWTRTNGHVVYTSERLTDLWGRGFASIGEITFESAAYVARYALKKIVGSGAARHYGRVDNETGEVVELQPEYTTMSLKPAIAKNWFAEFSSDVYPDDFVVSRGMRMKPPKYYDKLLELRDPSAYAETKLKRLGDAKRREKDSTARRLADREVVKLAQISNLKRNLE